ncbi:MAG: hypothetical protein IPP62_17965 [bacterium]|nr:hypothetical protein [bacterium]
MRAALFEDGSIDDEDVDLLVLIRNETASVSSHFTEFCFECLKSNILADGDIDDGEADKIRAILYADGVIDEEEKAFLKDLKASANRTSAKFDALYAECVD